MFKILNIIEHDFLYRCETYVLTTDDPNYCLYTLYETGKAPHITFCHALFISKEDALIVLKSNLHRLFDEHEKTSYNIEMFEIVDEDFNV